MKRIILEVALLPILFLVSGTLLVIMGINGNGLAVQFSRPGNATA
ncbi:hypothetical protein KP77_05000 [Jeotgalibacillus alimentarius]|uniref:Uncharacterized protein n=1 Tax=Jeotgalibacillus alimentarius TaxID=135826 RepID=A0A0C2SHV7_9BACL|nr:hypothetical protein KP77_05000 [Jeotgalibacillus alimentarius]